MKNIEKQVEHCWKPMEEYKINDKEFLDWTEGGIINKIEIMKKMKPNQYIIYENVPNGFINGGLKLLNKFIENLKENGLEIGKGNCEYGYKMPLPKPGDSGRDLIIFRRY